MLPIACRLLASAYAHAKGRARQRVPGSCPGPDPAAPCDLVPSPAHGRGIGECQEAIGNRQQAICKIQTHMSVEKVKGQQHLEIEEL